MEAKELTPEEKEKQKKLVEYFAEYEKAKAEGYAGMLPNGNLVDRRKHPEAIPIQKNTMFGIPEPKKL